MRYLVNILTLLAKYSGSKRSKEAVKGLLWCLYKNSLPTLKKHYFVHFGDTFPGLENVLLFDSHSIVIGKTCLMRDYFLLVLHSRPSPNPHPTATLFSPLLPVLFHPFLPFSFLPSPIHFYSILNWEQSKKNVKMRKRCFYSFSQWLLWSKWFQDWN